MVILIKYKRVIIMSLVIFSIVFGMYLYSKLNDDNINFFITNINAIKYINLKTIIIHLIILSLSFVFSFIGIGIIILLIYLFLEGITIGFMVSFFITVYKSSGVITAGAYLLIFKFFIIFFIIVLILKYIKLLNGIVKFLKHQSIDISKTIINSVIIIFCIILYDVFLLFTGDYLLNIFIF